MQSYDFSGITEWNRIRGWFDLNKAIAVQRRVKELANDSTLVELGSFQGRSSVAIGAVLPDGARLHCVDHFQGSSEHYQMNIDVSDLKQGFMKNIEAFGVSDRIETVDMTTLEAATHFEDESVDFILLDASHDYDSVSADLNAWYPKLRSGGMLFCDDYDPRWPGVMKAVAEFGIDGDLAAPALWFHRKQNCQP